MIFFISHVSVFFFISLMLVALLYVYQSTLIYSDHALPKILTIFLYIGFTYMIMAMDANLINRLVLYFVPLLFITLNTALWKVIFCASIHPWLLALYIGRYYQVTPNQAHVLLISELLLLVVLASLKALLKNRHVLGFALALFFALLEYWQSYQFLEIITPKNLVTFGFVFIGYAFFSWLICYIDDLYQKRRESLLYDIHNDTLTGVYNYHQLTEDLFRKPPIDNKNAWIIVFDIDYFKHINDTYGHQEGNIALKLFADTLESSYQEALSSHIHRIYRYGGEEFVLLVSSNPKQFNNEQTKLTNMLTTFQQNLLQQSTFKLQQPLTYSAGISYTKVYQYHSLQAFEAADRCLYEAKAGGRNTFKFDDKPLP